MSQELIARLRQHITARSLLTHPFYTDWREGKLSLDDLRLYATQYYHFEASFPRYLSAVHTNCPDPEVRQSILSNLWDEEHGQDNHRAQWLGFCAGLGLAPEDVISSPVHPKTRALMDSYSSICSGGSFQEGLAAVYAYEFQVPEVAAEKLAGLRDLYGIVDQDATAFFSLHSVLDEEHSRLEEEAIAQHTGADQEPAVESALTAALEALWGFLDGVNELRAGERAVS